MRFLVDQKCFTKFIQSIPANVSYATGYIEWMNRTLVKTDKEISCPAGFRFIELKEIDPGSYAVDEVES